MQSGSIKGFNLNSYADFSKPDCIDRQASGTMECKMALAYYLASENESPELKKCLLIVCQHAFK